MAFLEAEHISFTYPDEQQTVLHNLSFTVERGDFILLCGPSGSGKSTLLRLIKKEVAPYGKLEGAFYLDKHDISTIQPEKRVKKIGMVFQDPENQLVMDNVLQELIFGMENLGASTMDMRKRIAEIIHFFGLEDLLHRKTHELSGGQKQLVNLASVLLLEPELLLLDEPTAQLDPIAAREFLAILKMMNEEFGITVIIAEHRLEELFGMADRAIVLDNGRMAANDIPRQVLYSIGKNKDHPMYNYLPSTTLVYLENTKKVKLDEIPLTVKEGKQWLRNQVISTGNPKEPVTIKQQNELLKVKQVDFRYSRDAKNVLDALSLTVSEGDWLSIVGANGTGKSTLLKLMAGLERPHHGSIFFKGSKLKKPLPQDIGYLPQNPKLFFMKETIEEELNDLIDLHHINEGEEIKRMLLSELNIETIKDKHPYDVSGGEVQKAALAGVLLARPSLLLLDEPTKGLDPEAKDRLGTLLASFQKQGLTIVMVTHDIEFAASFSSRCAMLFDGEITTESSAKAFFKGNAFYTTTLNRMTRNSNVPNIVTIEEARSLWRVQE